MTADDGDLEPLGGLAQVADTETAHDLHRWMAAEAIRVRIRPHRGGALGSLATGVDHRAMPDQVPVTYRYIVEVHRTELDRALAALQAGGWNSDGYRRRWWHAQTLSLLLLTVAFFLVTGAIFLLSGP